MAHRITSVCSVPQKPTVHHPTPWCKASKVETSLIWHMRGKVSEAGH